MTPVSYRARRAVALTQRRHHLTAAPSTCAAATLLVCIGCVAPVKYIPATLGLSAPGETRNGLQVHIRPQSDGVTPGTPIVFEVTIRNAGDVGFFLARNPNLVFVWTYPNGQRDNFVREFAERRFFSRDEAVYLGPGDELTVSRTIETHFFPKTGITEFHAILYSEKNTNPDLRPFWHGWVASNFYGVFVGNRKHLLRRELGRKDAPAARLDPDFSRTDRPAAFPEVRGRARAPTRQRFIAGVQEDG